MLISWAALSYVWLVNGSIFRLRVHNYQSLWSGCPLSWWCYRKIACKTMLVWPSPKVWPSSTSLIDERMLKPVENFYNNLRQTEAIPGSKISEHKEKKCFLEWQFTVSFMHLELRRECKITGSERKQGREIYDWITR